MKQIKLAWRYLHQFLQIQSFTGSNKKLLLPLLIVISFMACQKNLNDTQNLSSRLQTDSRSASKENSTIGTDWYKLQLQFVLHGTPFTGGRFYAYCGVTLYEAVRNGIPGAVSLHDQLYQMPEMPLPDNNGYSWPIAANAALADITRDLFSPIPLSPSVLASIDSMEAASNEKLKPNENSQVAARSKAFGKAVAAAIFEWSKSDLYDHVNDPYPVPTFPPGVWEPTPPGYFPVPVAPYMGKCRPFLQSHITGITPPLPFPYSEDPASDFYKMVKDIYDVSQTLTDEQKTIAVFWNDVGIGLGFSPTGHEISILTQVLENEHASLGTAAEAYAKTGIAQWDATIVCWRSKYAYNLLRPVTYIQKLIDPAWSSFIITPAHPEYPAAHSLITAAAMRAMTSVFGENYAFDDHTYDFRGLGPRHYDSFDAAAIEAGESRRYGGIHYSPSINAGLELGVNLGNDVGNIKFTK